MEYVIISCDKDMPAFRYLTYDGERYVWADKNGYVEAVHAGRNRKETRFMFVSREEAEKVLAKYKNKHADKCCFVGVAPYVSILSMFYESINGTVYTGKKLRNIYCDFMQKNPETTPLIEAEDYFVEDIGTMKVVSAEKAFIWLFKHGDLPDMVAAVRTKKQCSLKEAYEFVKTMREKKVTTG